MSQEKPSILLGLHDHSVLKSYRTVCKIKGYKVDEATTPEEMLAEAKKGKHVRYLMDLNFGSPADVSVDVARQVYGAVYPRVAEGVAKFMGISGNLETITAAEEAGIPAEDKTTFSLINFLKEDYSP